MPDLHDTIVALSSAPGPGARAVVRLSGPAAPRMVQSLMAAFAPDPLARRQVVSGDLALPGVASPLPADLFYLRAPATYTGQDLVELHTISSPPLMELLVAQLLHAGARAARPGEFTMRAFLAGKLDLTRAEAVHAVVEASSPDQLRHALLQLAGGMAGPLDGLREDLLNLLADLEAGLDFADEDLSFIDQAALLGRLAKALAQVTLVSKQIDQRSVSPAHFRVVLAGPPNAGKSSLFNALLGRDAAIVSPQAGTTRDYLEADLVLGESALRLFDTAGQGEAGDPIDAQAQSMARGQSAEADFVLWCQRLGQGVTGPGLLVGTMSDQGDVTPGWLAVSALTGDGLVDLKQRLVEQVKSRRVSPLAPSLSRCRRHVEACLTHLRRAHALVLDEDAAELQALEIRLALDELGAMVGAVYTDDLLDRVFSRFCIGK